MQTLWQDLRFALRMLMKNRGFTAVAVLTLAMAIGANAVVFSVLNALILHPLHIPQAESFYGIQHGNEPSSYQSYPDYLDLRERNRSFMISPRMMPRWPVSTQAKIHRAPGSFWPAGI